MSNNQQDFIRQAAAGAGSISNQPFGSMVANQRNAMIIETMSPEAVKFNNDLASGAVFMLVNGKKVDASTAIIPVGAKISFANADGTPVVAPKAEGRGLMASATGTDIVALGSALGVPVTAASFQQAANAAAAGFQYASFSSHTAGMDDPNKAANLTAGGADATAKQIGRSTTA